MDLLQKSGEHLGGRYRKINSTYESSRIGGQNGLNGGHALPDSVDEKQFDGDWRELLYRTRPSSQFLDVGYHRVLNDFPWKKKDSLRDQDHDVKDRKPSTRQPSLSIGTTGGGMYLSQISQRSRIPSDESEDVFEPEDMNTVTMMEEEANDEQRRIQANLKWNQRRLKIEEEINRIRRYSVNRSPTRPSRHSTHWNPHYRHSMSFGDNLKMKLDRMRDLEEVDEENDEVHEVDTESGGNDRITLSKPPLAQRVKSNTSTNALFSRSLSTGNVLKMGKLSVVPSSLDIHEEEEGEEGMEQVELPRSDIPLNTLAQLEGFLKETNELDDCTETTDDAVD